MTNLLNEIDIVRDIAEKLEKNKIEYMLTGSLALNYYSNPRMTRDIDIVVELNKYNINKISEVFAKEYYVADEAVEEAIKYQTLFNIIHNISVIKVDFIIRKDEEYRKVEFDRRKKVNFFGTDVYIVSIEDLIISKTFWMKDFESKIQINDIKNLLKLNFDKDYLFFWLKKLNLFENIKDLLK